MDIEKFKRAVADGLKTIERAVANPVSHDIEHVLNDERSYVSSAYLRNHGNWDQLDQMFAESYFRYFLSQIVKIEVKGY